MNIVKITPGAILEVTSHQFLRRAWRSYGFPDQLLIKKIVVRKPLTEARFRRLPKGLKDLVVSR